MSGAADGVVDCHCHVFDDPLRHPLRAAAGYTPPFSPVSTLGSAGAAAGIAQHVLVQPTPYGDDLTLLLASMAVLATRGVGVARAGMDTAALQPLRAAGIVALRFVETRQPDGSRIPGTVPVDALCDALAPHLQALDMHAEIWSPLAQTLADWPRLERSGIPIVLDHMGGFDTRLGPRHADFRSLLAILREGQVWIKLATCRRSLGVDPEAVRPFHDALVETNSHRLVWASDFPFVRHPDPAPTLLELLAQFHHWVADPVIRSRILARNPRRLYRFGPP